MVNNLQQTPLSGRTHITIFGKRNAGKSSLINALTGQDIALVSETPGTTTDPVFKSMEIHGIGPCVLIDTAGFDDIGELGQQRVNRTLRTVNRTEVALLICTSDDITQELSWAEQLKKQQIPIIWILNKTDLIHDVQSTVRNIESQCGAVPVPVCTHSRQGIDEIIQRIIGALPDESQAASIVGHLVSAGDLVLLVMPQDIQAPKGRLILPQVQTLRELLDRKCMIMSCTTDVLTSTLQSLSYPPKLIITDSQVFKTVYDLKPKESLLTSFSVLFAQYKGDINTFIEGAKAINQLTPESNVLIAEACTHAPLTEDIGRIKIPRLLRQRIGEELNIDIVSGNDFPTDLTRYQLIIHCGACMFNRKHVMSRIQKARQQGVAITNYGITIASLQGILDKINY